MGLAIDRWSLSLLARYECGGTEPIATSCGMDVQQVMQTKKWFERKKASQRLFETGERRRNPDNAKDGSSRALLHAGRGSTCKPRLRGAGGMDDGDTPVKKRRRGGGFRCSDCRRFFNRERDLRRHIRLRTQNTPGARRNHLCFTGVCVSGSGDSERELEESQRSSVTCSSARFLTSGNSSSEDVGEAAEQGQAATHPTSDFQLAENVRVGTLAPSHGVAGDAASESSCADMDASNGTILEASERVSTTTLLDERSDGYESLESWANGRNTDDDVLSDRDCSSGDGHPSSNDGESDLEADPPFVHAEASPAAQQVSPHHPAQSLDEEGGTPWLGDLHRVVGAKLGGECVEGHEVKARNFPVKSVKPYRPFKNLTELLLFTLAVKHQLSRVAMTDLFSILRFVDGEEGDGAGEGTTFDVGDVPSSGEHFVSRLRQYLPLM